MNGLKVKQLTIESEGRDKGKVFVITEMPAIQADKWGRRVLLTITKSGHEVPDEVMRLGIAGVLHYGLNRLKGVDFDDLEPSFDEILTCVKIIPDPSNLGIVRALFPGDFMEVQTIGEVRGEWFKLHTAFFPIAGR